MPHAGTGSTAASPRDREDGGEGEVQEFLDTFSRALVKGDGKKVATLWETPSFVASDEQCMAVASQDEVVKFFSGAKDQYNDQGVTDTRPEIGVLDWVTDRMALVEVRWPWLDANGDEVADETSTYLLRRDDKGNLKIRAAIMHGKGDTH